MRKLLVLTALCSAVLAGCNSEPSEKEIRAVLEPIADKKGCAHYPLFKNFPVAKQKIKMNDDIMALFIKNGFLKDNANSYDLTDQGRLAYDKDHEGFCYTNKYIVTDIQVLKEEKSETHLPQGSTGAWYVSFKVSPGNVDEWIKNPEIIKAAEKRATLEDITGTKSFKVLMFKKAGEDQLKIAFSFSSSLSFNFHPGISFPMGF